MNDPEELVENRSALVISDLRKPATFQFLFDDQRSFKNS
jgi:hypothetical protein